MAEIEQARVPTRRPRTRPIGLRIAMLLAVPLASLIVLWAIAAVPALNAAVKRAAFAANSDAIGQPSNLAMQGVQMERAAAVAALTSESAVGRVINAGTGQDVSVNELAALVEPDAARIVHVPHIHPQSEIAVLRCDPKLAAELLDWRPTVSLPAGLMRVRGWMEERLGAGVPVL